MRVFALFNLIIMDQRQRINGPMYGQSLLWSCVSATREICYLGVWSNIIGCRCLTFHCHFISNYSIFVIMKIDNGLKMVIVGVDFFFV